jgi:hypothetical protein
MQIMEPAPTVSKKQAIANIQAWLVACVSCAEADGYQEHEGEEWAGDDGSPELFWDADLPGFVVRYRGRTFDMKLIQRRGK